MKKQSTFELVTNQILEALEKGVVPWKMPWQQNDARPLNIRSVPFSCVKPTLDECRKAREQWINSIFN